MLLTGYALVQQPTFTVTSRRNIGRSDYLPTTSGNKSQISHSRCRLSQQSGGAATSMSYTAPPKFSRNKAPSRIALLKPPFAYLSMCTWYYCARTVCSQSTSRYVHLLHTLIRPMTKSNLCSLGCVGVDQIVGRIVCCRALDHSDSPTDHQAPIPLGSTPLCCVDNCIQFGWPTAPLQLFAVDLKKEIDKKRNYSLL